MSPPTDCSLYAELLANIRQISLAASLPSPSDGSTQATLSADCRTVELRHRGSACQLTLPARAALGGARLPIQDKQKGGCMLSWRLPLDASSASSSPPPGQADDAPPWSATDLAAGAAVTCRQCGADVVPSGAVTVWKDLPSENWAEMMEFWHCHKPHTAPHDHGDGDGAGKADEKSLASRGYGASSAISAQEGVGFVDLTTLLFAEADCRGVTLGFFNFRTSAVTLLKWQVSCTPASGAAPSIPECLAATLISTISRSGSSKSLITPINETIQLVNGSAASGSGRQTAIHIWVLNSSIVYATSHAARRRTPAMKLLYRSIPREEADRMLEAVTCDAQEINLPAQALCEVVRHLEDSNVVLPPTERMFKEWKVGLLTRWESKG